MLVFQRKVVAIFLRIRIFCALGQRAFLQRGQKYLNLISERSPLVIIDAEVRPQNPKNVFTSILAAPSAERWSEFLGRSMGSVLDSF